MIILWTAFSKTNNNNTWENKTLDQCWNAFYYLEENQGYKEQLFGLLPSPFPKSI